TTENARDRVIYNEQLIIVLVDRFTLSSGEIFADQFTNVENTLVIGQNTFGMLLTSSGLPLYLPNSGMPVSMGRYKLVHPENTWQEGVGFSPDIWVLGDALTAAWAILDLS
ncbi:MAG: S41 family peptidase, partial [Defluviitaleaceae bacterium]|nr:S41 family peptidase [Defluviitaleaceae bacterium]